MYALQRSLAIFEETFGLPYPWETYGIVALPGFRYGGMENKGLTNIRADSLYVGADRPMDRRYGAWGIVAHELAHEWFGNLVTMQWWDDVWLNEGFASYMTGLSVMDEFDWVYRRLSDYAGLQRWYMDLERGPFAHPIVYDDWTTPEQLFDGISYTKGRKVLDMLEHMIGRENLFAGIRAYLEQNAGSNAATGVFFRTIEETIDQDLSGFVEPWLFHAGFPELTVSPAWDDQLGVYRVTIEQRSSRGAEDDTLWSFPMQIAVEGDGYSEEDWVIIVDRHHELVFELASEPSSLSLNRGGIALVDIVVEGWTWQNWADQALNDTSPFGRGMAIFEMLDLVRTEFDAVTMAGQIQQLAAPIAAAISGDDEGLRRFAIGRIGDSGAPEEMRQALAAELLGPLTQLVRTDAGDDLLAVQSRRAALGALGYVDQVTTQELLREASEDRIDYLVPAVGALMHTTAADRYDVHSAALARAAGDQRMVGELVSALAATSDPAKFGILAGYLDDETVCSPLDHWLPRRVLYGVLSTPDLAYDEAGLEFMLQVFENEMDRPGTIIRVVRAMQDASERSVDEQRRLRGMLNDLEQLLLDAGDPEGASEVVRMLRDSLVE
jgi:aminopeptidase N